MQDALYTSLACALSNRPIPGVIQCAAAPTAERHLCRQHYRYADSITGADKTRCRPEGPATAARSFAGKLIQALSKEKEVFPTKPVKRKKLKSRERN